MGVTEWLGGGEGGLCGDVSCQGGTAHVVFIGSSCIVLVCFSFKTQVRNPKVCDYPLACFCWVSIAPF